MSIRKHGECGFRSRKMITNPFTKLSEVPPGFIAIKFWASLIKTCSSPPFSVITFLPEEEMKTKCFQKFEAKFI